MPATGARRRRDRSNDAVAVAGLVAVALVPLAIASAFGAFGLSRNDDWSYSEILWRWTETGHLRLNGYESMSLIGQLSAAWPIGRLWPDQREVLQVATALVGAVGVAAWYGTLRRFLPTSRSFLAAALSLIAPVYAPLAGSFMTDIPAFSAQAVCAWLGTGSLAASRPKTRTGLLITAVAVGLYGNNNSRVRRGGPLARG